MESLKGKVITVQGLREASDLGVTLTHEHLTIQIPSFYTPPKEKLAEKLKDVAFEMQYLGWIRQNPYTHIANLTLEGEYDAIKEELLFFKENGGQTIVENTTLGISPNLPYLRNLSESTGINIICGTGFYVDAAQTDTVLNLSEETMAESMRRDILEGREGIRSGMIGEIGTSWPVTDFEKKSLRSSAAVQEDLGCPVIIHPGRNPQAPGEVLRILLEAGGKAQNTVMSHLDRTIFNKSTLLEFAELGSYLEYDLFGIEVSHYQLQETVDMPSDAQRVQTIKALLDEGYEDRVVVSHDIHTKHRLMKYGGHGYSHILLNVVPTMLKRGITQHQVDKILKHNPHNWLKFFK
ncbi:phosphotriesterase-related protein-like [Physella acuta]|uniref:phosphotriesterase-related protein-like n=1 Tax=Physella acuta TaxID=109671 RepID=UPI0027DE2E02|nr:phosphotriesterase-related protein-like [Physella acuta]